MPCPYGITPSGVKNMRVIHYVNQFFGGLGGEEKAGTPLEVYDGATGPGRLLERLLGTGAEIVMTSVCGDNYAVETSQRWSTLRSRESTQPTLICW